MNWSKIGSATDKGLGILLAGMLWGQVASAQVATNYAQEDLFFAGTVAGTYADTYANDDGCEALTEITNSRYSYLEHKWRFDVSGGTTVIFNVVACRPNNSDGDNFIFAWSADGTTYNDLLTIATDAKTTQSVTLVGAPAGTIFVRVLDTDRRNSKRSKDTLYVDRMWILSHGTPPMPADNLLNNGGFEDGTTAWYAYSPCVLTTSTAQVHGGAHAGYVTGRTAYWQGPVHDMRNIMANGMSYTNRVWVRIANTSAAPVTLTIKKVANGQAEYTHLTTNVWAGNSGWTELVGAYTLQYTGTLSELNMYIEGPPPGVNFYADDAVLIGSGEWEAEADARIELLRKRDMRIRLLDALGRPLTNAAVAITQTRHDFAFGSALSQWVRSTPRYADFFARHFEWAVFENETKWSQNEPETGMLDYDNADAMANYCVSNNIRMRGHCIFWEVESHVQEWVRELTNAPAELRAAVSNRLDSVVPRYRGRFEHWDVNNEMLHGAFYSNYLGGIIRPWMFQRAAELDPDARLFVNDYGVVSFSDTDQYVAHIQGLRAAGAPVGGIGAQCHMWELNPYLVLARLNTLGEVGLPVWCTEFDISAPDENERARLLKTFYKTAFSHPAVGGILMWGFWASNHWRGANAALVNGDWTTNAAGRQYESLMRAWTTRTNRAADAAGTLTFRGFHGVYTLAITSSVVTALVAQVALPVGEGTNELTLVVSGPDADADGMPDLWEQRYGLNVYANDSGVDLDGDGLCNLGEYRAATDPTNGQSCLWLSLTPATSNMADCLSFASAGHRLYDLQYKPTLTAAVWLVVASNHPGNGAWLTLTNAADSETGFYRLRARLP